MRVFRFLKKLHFKKRHFSRIKLTKKTLIFLAVGISLGAIGISYFLIQGNAVEAAPWGKQMESFLKRKQLALINTTGQQLEANTTYTITVDTKSLYDSGDLQGSCEDIRIAYQPDSTTTQQLSYYFDPASGTTCATSTATKVYFPLQANISSSSSNRNYYLYYKNAGASDESSVDAFDIGSAQALMHCGFNGDTNCINGDGAEAPTTESGAIRYSGSKSALSFDGGDYA
ncbi:hypothetical protein KBD81_04960, partial [Candidatus Woesebacteria bacterium]|nr:hypothetical protein [Candidatus Woesebacteria bacterium]